MAAEYYLNNCADMRQKQKSFTLDNETTLFKVLADSIRLRLAVLLAIQGEKCVCQLAEALNEPGFKVSRHLGIMRSAGMVDVRREGTWMHYKLTEPRDHLEICLQETLRASLANHEIVKGDLKRLATAKCLTEKNM